VGSTPIVTIAGSAGKHPELLLKPVLKQEGMSDRKADPGAFQALQEQTLPELEPELLPTKGTFPPTSVPGRVSDKQQPEKLTAHLLPTQLSRLRDWRMRKSILKSSGILQALAEPY